MIVTHYQEELADWLCTRIKMKHASGLVCIGNVIDGDLKGVVGFDNYNGASIQMHVAGKEGWLTKEMLRVSFHYPFVVCRVNMVIGLISSANKKIIRFTSHIGFRTRAVLEKAHPDGDLLVIGMTRDECRFLRN